MYCAAVSAVLQTHILDFFFELFWAIIFSKLTTIFYLSLASSYSPSHCGCILSFRSLLFDHQRELHNLCSLSRCDTKVIKWVYSQNAITGKESRKFLAFVVRQKIQSVYMIASCFWLKLFGICSISTDMSKSTCEMIKKFGSCLARVSFLRFVVKLRWVRDKSKKFMCDSRRTWYG